MRNSRAVWAALVVAGVFAVGCGADDGLSREEVDAAIADAVAGLPEPQPGVSAADVEEAVRAEVQEAIRDAIAAVAGAQPEPAGGEAAELSKSDPAAYTRHVVAQAVALYEDVGLDAALAHFNSAESVDGEWYVFVIDETGEIVGHHDPTRLGEDMNGWVGTDINGYSFGPEMLAATEAGRWVPYVYVNPAEGSLGDEASFDLKNTWVVRHDGLLFASGWYINIEEFVPQFISESAEHFREGGLEALLEFYNDPQGIAAGSIPTAEYYNSTDTLDGYFLGFIADPDGTILTHLDPGLIGSDIEDLLGPAVFDATTQGRWITAADNPDTTGPESMRVYVVNVNNTLIGGGWYRT